SSRVTQAIRDLGRDARNLDLTPHAELFLYVTRDLQLMDEVTRPALGRADLVIADRFLYSAEVLARWGRGLPESWVRPVLVPAALELARAQGAGPRPPSPPLASPQAALARFLDIVDQRAKAEPHVAAYLMGGLHGEEVDPRRWDLLERAPETLLDGAEGLTD